jgi:hypothetical protein
MAATQYFLRQTEGARRIASAAGTGQSFAGRKMKRGAIMFCKTAMAVSLLLASSAWAQDEKTAPATPYTQDTPLETLAADPAAAAILNKDLPGLLTDAQYPIFKRMSLKTLQQASGGDLSKSDVNKTVADLQALPPR